MTPKNTALMIFLVLAARSTAAQVPTVDDLVSLTSPGEVALSPDGSVLAYVVTETNWEDDRYEREIWLAREGEKPYPFTNAERSSFNRSGRRTEPRSRFCPIEPARISCIG